MSYSSIPKQTNDLINGGFYHSSPVALSVKSTISTGVVLSANGKSAPSGAISGGFEAQFPDKVSGVTLTQGWTTDNKLNTKFALPSFAPGLKTDLATTFVPSSGTRGANVTFNYSHGPFTSKVFADLLKGPTFKSDFAFTKSSASIGGEVEYDVPAGAVKGYAAGVGYSGPSYSVFATATSKLSVFSAGYYTKPSDLVQVATKATWNSKEPAQAVDFELASQYKISATSFSKAKISNKGIVTLAYTNTLQDGVKLGFGVSVDTQKLNEPVHKAGLSFSFESKAPVKA
ncbi:eukaryotic porin/Tom40 [Kockiozyma suomiensis]|uniref:eukaryotic porin/Tom40 n=1 Tax=Kockiozyma suomiensis TaxID=1337062 RepID=UPI003343A41F